MENLPMSIDAHAFPWISMDVHGYPTNVESRKIENLIIPSPSHVQCGSVSRLGLPSLPQIEMSNIESLRSHIYQKLKIQRIHPEFPVQTPVATKSSHGYLWMSTDIRRMSKIESLRSHIYRKSKIHRFHPHPISENIPPRSDRVASSVYCLLSAFEAFSHIQTIAN